MTKKIACFFLLIFSMDLAHASEVPIKTGAVSVAFSPVDTKIAAIYSDLTIQISDWQKGSNENTFKVTHDAFEGSLSFGLSGNLSCFKFSPDGKYLIACYWFDPHVQVYEVQTGKKVFEKGYPGVSAPGLGDVDFASRRVVVFNGYLNVADTYDLISGERISRIRDDGAKMMWSFQISPFDDSIYTMGKENCALKRWSMLDGTLISKAVDDDCSTLFKFDPETNFPVVNTRYNLKRLGINGWEKMSALNHYFPPETQVPTYYLIDYFWLTKDLVAILGDGPNRNQSCLRIFNAGAEYEIKRICASAEKALGATVINNRLYYWLSTGSVIDVNHWEDAPNTN